MMKCLTMLFVLAVQVSFARPQAALAPLDSALVDTLVKRPEASFRKKPHIAILPFDNANAQAKEAEFGRTVSAMLGTALRNETNFVVVERSELNRLLNEQLLAGAGLTKEKTRELQRLYNVEVILIGDVSLINSTLHIDARLVETRSSEIVVALYGTCSDLKQIRDVVEDLARQLQEKYLRQWMGSVYIRSEPSGAEVYLEDKFIGFTKTGKPLQVDDLLEGKYRLKLILGGYYDWEGDIVVPAKMERNVKVSLIAKPGSMNIYSEPAGADIFLDNNRVGQTPMSLKTVAEGEHQIRLVKENYKPWTQNVNVRSFQPTDVKATLEVSPGLLTINSEPAGASIFFKGKFVAKTPHTLSNIPPGEVVLHVEKDGYEDWTKSLLIQPNQHKIIDAVLRQKRGTISIVSQPEGARVYLHRWGETGNREIGVTPLLNYDVTIGDYDVAVDKTDYFAVRKHVTVRHKEMADVRFELRERPGAILADTFPANARVFLNGRYRGRSPLTLRGLAKGSYEVKLSVPYADTTGQITVAPNRRAVVRAGFRKPGRYILGISSIALAGIVFHLLAN